MPPALSLKKQLFFILSLQKIKIASVITKRKDFVYYILPVNTKGKESHNFFHDNKKNEWSKYDVKGKERGESFLNSLLH